MPEFLAATELPWPIKISVILGAALVLSVLIRLSVRRFQSKMEGGGVVPTARQKKVKTLSGLLKAASTIIIWTAAALMVLGEFGVNVGPLIAAAGVGGLAVGFGAQNLVRDTIAGFFILLENQYDVGDVIKAAGVSGAVEQVSLRTTTLRDLSGSRHVIPNGEIRVSTNLTKGFSRYVIDLPVPYEADLDKALEAARQAAAGMRDEEAYRDLILGDAEILGVDSYESWALVIKLYVETMPGKQWIVGRELRARIKKAFEGIGIPVLSSPQRLVVQPRPRAAKGNSKPATKQRSKP